MTVSGRPSYIQVGGELGYPILSSTGAPSVGFKEYGTRLDFVPIVLGNGRIHLDVRPRVSQPDMANAIENVPAIKTREAETGVEMRAGQTLAIGGLVEQRIEATSTGIPWISEVPYVGALFGTKQEQINEVELLILVTPEIVEALDANQVPPCGPGMQTTSPSDWELFFKGHLEVPICNGCSGSTCGSPTAAPSAATAPGASPASAPDAARQIPEPAAATATGSTSGLRVSNVAPRNPQNSYASSNPNARPSSTPDSDAAEPSFIGPIGYDVLQ